MKDLIDELHKLDNDNYKVSPDFSKRVMKQIKRDNRYKALKYVASLASAACVLGVSIMLVRNSDLLARILESSKSADISNEQMVLSLEESTAFEPAKESEPDTINDVISTDYAKAYTEGASPTSTINSVMDSAEETNTSDYDDILDKKAVTNRSDNNRTYSKQLSKDDYLNEIKTVLTSNNYKISGDNEYVQIYDADFTSIYNLLEEYIDVETSISGDDIVVKLKE